MEGNKTPRDWETHRRRDHEGLSQEGKSHEEERDREGDEEEKRKEEEDGRWE